MAYIGVDRVLWIPSGDVANAVASIRREPFRIIAEATTNNGWGYMASTRKSAAMAVNTVRQEDSIHSPILK